MRPISAVQGDPNSQINQMMAKQIAREEARERAVAEKKAREAAALEVRLRLYPTHQRWSNFFTSQAHVPSPTHTSCVPPLLGRTNLLCHCGCRSVSRRGGASSGASSLLQPRS